MDWNKILSSKTGNSDYYVKFDQTNLAATGVQVLEINNAGNYLTSTGVSSAFTLIVPPDLAPASIQDMGILTQ